MAVGVGVMVWPENSTQAGDQSLPQAPPWRSHSLPTSTGPAFTMAGGRPQSKRSFSIIPCFVFVEVRNPVTLSLPPLRPSAPQTCSQTLSGEEARSEGTLPGFQTCSVHP